MNQEKQFTLRDAVPTVTASVISGIATRIPLHPIDTIKSQRQAFTNSSTMFQLLREQKLKNLYSGFGVTCLVSVPGVTLYFGVYEAAKKFFHQYFNIPLSETNHIINFCSGLIAESISCVVWVPGEIMKERLQIQQLKNTNISHHFRGPKDILLDVYRKEGLRGVYRGYYATLISFGPYSAFYLSFYEVLKKQFCLWSNIDPIHPTLFLSFCAGGLAGAAASLLTAPLDLIKIRLQMQRAAARASQSTPTTTMIPTPPLPTSITTNQQYLITYNYSSVYNGLKTIYAENGVKGLFRGAGVRMAFSAPAAAITISLWDSIKSHVDLWMNPITPQTTNQIQLSNNINFKNKQKD